jgi:hypothetical protein
LARDGDGAHAWHSAYRCSELLDHGATAIVLSQGMLKRLGICPETLKLLKQHGVRVHVLPTQDAVDLYNDLLKTEQAAGLFHTTC